MAIHLRTLELYAVIIGGFFLVLGTSNLIDPPFLGIFTSNRLHAFIHLSIGLSGVWTGFKNRSHPFVLKLGILLIIVGVLFFFDPTKAWVADFFFMKLPVVWLNIIIGATSLVVLFVGKRLSKMMYPEV